MARNKTVLNVQFNKNIFRNSWSCLGFMSEALSPSFVASDKPLPAVYFVSLSVEDMVKALPVLEIVVAPDPVNDTIPVTALASSSAFALREVTVLVSVDEMVKTFPVLLTLVTPLPVKEIILPKNLLLVQRLLTPNNAKSHFKTN